MTKNLTLSCLVHNCSLFKALYYIGHNVCKLSLILSLAISNTHVCKPEILMVFHLLTYALWKKSLHLFAILSNFRISIFVPFFQNLGYFLAILTYIWPFFTGRHPELSSPSHLSHPSQQAGNNRNLGLFSHFYDGQRQQSHFPRTSGEFFFTKVLLEFWVFGHFGWYYQIMS